MRDGCNVEQKWFPVGWGDPDRGLRQELLDLVKCLLGLRHPFKMVSLLQKPIEGETSFTEMRDKATERSEPPRNLLYPLYVLNLAHSHDG